MLLRNSSYLDFSLHLTFRFGSRKQFNGNGHPTKDVIQLWTIFYPSRHIILDPLSPTVMTSFMDDLMFKKSLVCLCKSQSVVGDLKIRKNWRPIKYLHKNIFLRPKVRNESCLMFSLVNVIIRLMWSHFMVPLTKAYLIITAGYFYPLVNVS